MLNSRTLLPFCGAVMFLSMTRPSAQAQEQTPTPKWKLTPFGSTDKLLASGKAPTRLEAFKGVPVQIDAVRGEYVNFQFVISAGDEPIRSLSIEPTSLASIVADIIPVSGMTLYRENYVHVSKPSGNRIREPKWWPDALVPLSLASQNIEAGESAVFWASLRVPAEIPAGEYYGELDIACNGQPRRLALTIDVRPLVLPPTNFRATAALYYDSLRDWYKKSGREFSDAQWQEQKQRYANFLLDYGIAPYDPPVAWSDDAAIDAYLKDSRVHSVRTPPLDAPDFKSAFAALKRTNTLAKAFYYWNDEPQTPAQFAAIRQNAQQLRPLGIPQLVTAHPSDELKGAVDIWCPNIANALANGHLDVQALRRERDAGHATWLYTMVIPKHPYPTWLLDDDSSAILSYAPLWAHTGATGFVYSMVHGWGPHPLEDLTSFADTNGDGTLLYPAELAGGQGPMPSIRLMLLRDALEDYALWHDAVSKHIAVRYDFPVQREKALIYDRKTLLDALQEGKPRNIFFGPLYGLWSPISVPLQTSYKSPQTWPLGTEQTVKAQLTGGNLSVEFSGHPLGENDLLTVIVERADIEKQVDQWRLYFSKKGLEIQKRTPSGRFAATLPGVRAVKTATGARFWIPLQALNLKSDAVRFNASWTNEKGAARLFADANDPFFVPLLKQSEAKRR